MFTKQENREQVLNQLSLSHLNTEECDSIISLCTEFAEIFHMDRDNLTFKNKIKHGIETENSKAAYTKSYR